MQRVHAEVQRMLDEQPEDFGYEVALRERQLITNYRHARRVRHSKYAGRPVETVQVKPGLL